MAAATLAIVVGAICVGEASHPTLQHVTLEATSVTLRDDPGLPPFALSCAAPHEFQVSGMATAHDDPQERGTFGGRLTIRPLEAAEPSDPVGSIVAEIGIEFDGGHTWAGFVLSDDIGRVCDITESVLRLTFAGDVAWVFADPRRQITVSGPAHADGALSIASDGTVSAFSVTLRLLAFHDPAHIALDPAEASNDVGTSHTVTATVRDSGIPGVRPMEPVPDVVVQFSVGGSVEVTGQCTTDVAGQCAFSYTGPPTAGVDEITAFADANGDGAMNGGEPLAVARAAWHVPTFPFMGFFEPLVNPPAVNVLHAGRGVPVKFSLGGDRGMSVLAAQPTSQAMACETAAPLGNVEETVTAGASGLRYDALADQYTYTWKTDKAWAGSCRRLLLQLIDGTNHHADFWFR